MVDSILPKLTGFEVPRFIEYVLALPVFGIGMFFLLWTTWTQWTVGGGTPAPNTPTQKLVVSGPYRLCRNPIEFGAVLYYFAAGTLWNGTMTGLVCFFLGLLIGSSYHKFVEEKELERRFGKEYLEYKRQTPFLFPKIEMFRR